MNKDAHAQEQERFTLADLPDPLDEQFLLTRLSVIDWGTFSGLHTMQIAEDGVLMLGNSGAGKSTLLDAWSTLLVPHKALNLNAAADEGERGRDRSVRSYVRGAYGSRSDADSNEVTTQFLRKKATRSVIALEFRTRGGRVLTLVGLFWISGPGNGATLHKHYMVVEGEFDIGAELREFDGDRRKLKARLDRPEFRHYDDNFSGYQSNWCRIFGIKEKTALELLHKTQSTKSLTSLNDFFRNYMLSVPLTFAAADTLVEGFSALDQAHQAVVADREQIELLAPARQQHGELEAGQKALQELAVLVKAVEPFQAKCEAGLIEDRLRAAALELETAESEAARLEAQMESLEEQIAGLEAEQARHGGADLVAIDVRLRELAQERDRCGQARDRAYDACRVLALDVPVDPAGLAKVTAAAAGRLAESEATAQAMDAKRAELAVRIHEREAAFRTLRNEITALEGASSSIDGKYLAVRARLCEALSLPVGKVPFVGELVQVREADRQAWGGAIDRLFRSLSLDLLVDQKDYRRVARWVDGNHLGIRLVYHGVEAGLPVRAAKSLEPHSVLHKVELREHPFQGWLWDTLTRRFDYRCVESASDLVGGEYRLTRQGQIRHRGWRTEKDDRRPIDDPMHWVLGFDNRDKVRRYVEQAQAVGEELEAAKRELRDLQEGANVDRDRDRAAQALAHVTWDQIDVAALADRYAALEDRRRRLAEGNPALDHVRGQLVQAREARATASRAHGAAKSRASELRLQRQQDERAIAPLRQTAALLDPGSEAALRARLTEEWAPSLASLKDDVRRLERGLHEERTDRERHVAELIAAITGAFAEFARRWPHLAANVQSNLDSAPEIFAHLASVELDGLPQHEARFLETLRTSSTRQLAELNSHLIEARRDISNRLAEVNDALHAASFNPDSYLALRLVDLHLPEPEDFRRRLTGVLSDQRRQSTDTAEAERQFEALRALVQELRAEDPERRRWRTLVLDVRRHVEFVAHELERGSDRQIEVYAGGGGKSGGQRQKLAATCLAAALRYQMGGEDGGVPQFATVMLDEAFDKTDAAFTRACVETFRKLGFHLVIATPLKSVMTLEEFVGGAIYVSIRDRKHSSVSLIEYDRAERRLKRDDVAAASSAHAHA